MSEWPQIGEPELLQRLALSDREFEEFLRALVSRMPAREYGEAVLQQALGYPWARPEGSYELVGDEVTLLSGLEAGERDDLIRRYASAPDRYLPVLAIGSNAAPEALIRKFAHFPDEDDRTVLVLTGRLHDFDVGVAPQPTLYGAMPATPFPSPGTEVCTAVLWVTPTQFTQLAWSELTYRLGRLRTRFDVDESAMGFDEVLVFVSRFGAFCIDGQPVALAAVPATGRSAAALTQEQLLDLAATLVLGEGASAETLVRAIFENVEQVAVKIAATLWARSLPFASEKWTAFSP